MIHSSNFWGTLKFIFKFIFKFISLEIFTLPSCAENVHKNVVIIEWFCCCCCCCSSCSFLNCLSFSFVSRLKFPVAWNNVIWLIKPKVCRSNALSVSQYFVNSLDSLLQASEIQMPDFFLLLWPHFFPWQVLHELDLSLFLTHALAAKIGLGYSALYLFLLRNVEFS